MISTSTLLLLFACRPPVATPVHQRQETGEVDPQHTDTGQPVESIPDAPLAGAETIYDPSTIHAFAIQLAPEAMDALDTDPFTYVQGSFQFQGTTWSPVGVRLKGNSSFQSLSGKPAWKVKFNEYTPGVRFFGLKRLTLDNNVWDPSMMAENLGYRVFREAGSPAPRTGYATMSLNDEPLGLYTIIESMDDLFVQQNWPDSEGGLYEMTRDCDFTTDCSCFELKDAGDNFDPDALARVCQAVDEGTVAALQRVFDWPALMAFFASERVINHPDSYTYNLNNYHLYHDPLTDHLSLSPWGGDSIFVYWYPPDTSGYACEPMSKYDNLYRSCKGYLGTWCQADAECWAELSAAMEQEADLLESMDLVALVNETADLLRDTIYQEPRNTNWGPEDFEYKISCFEEWIAQRPDEIRAFLAR